MVFSYKLPRPDETNCTLHAIPSTWSSLVLGCADLTHTHAHIHTYAHAHTHTHIHTYAHAHTHTYAHAHTHSELRVVEVWSSGHQSPDH